MGNYLTLYHDVLCGCHSVVIALRTWCRMAYLNHDLIIQYKQFSWDALRSDSSHKGWVAGSLALHHHMGSHGGIFKISLLWYIDLFFSKYFALPTWMDMDMVHSCEKYDNCTIKNVLYEGKRRKSLYFWIPLILKG